MGNSLFISFDNPFLSSHPYTLQWIFIRLFSLIFCIACSLPSFSSSIPKNGYRGHGAARLLFRAKIYILLCVQRVRWKRKFTADIDDLIVKFFCILCYKSTRFKHSKRIAPCSRSSCWWCCGLVEQKIEIFFGAPPKKYKEKHDKAIIKCNSFHVNYVCMSQQCCDMISKQSRRTELKMF